MKMILTHIARNIFEKKLRTSIVVVTILLSTMVIIIGLSLNDILNQTYATMVKGAYGDANILVQKQASEEDPFYHTEDLQREGVKINAQLDLIHAVGTSDQQGTRVNVSLTGLDVDVAASMNVVHSMEPVEEFTLTGDEVMISSRTASNYDIGMGDLIEVDIHNELHVYTVAAISQPTGLYYAEKDDILLVMSTDQLNEVYGTDNQVTSTLLTVDDERLDESLTALVDNNDRFTVQQTSQLESVMRDEDTFQTAVIIAIIIIVMISAYVILSLSKVIVSERMPTIGIFRSVGATKKMINRIVRLEFLCYGIIGALTGLVIALFCLPIVADQFNEYKEYGVKTVVQYRLIYIVIAFAFGAMFPLFIGMLHMYRANKRPLKEIILNTTHTVNEQSKTAMISGVILFVSSIGIHFVNKQDKLLLAAASVLLLFIAIVLLIPLLLNVISRCASILLASLPNGEVKLGIRNISNNRFVANNASMIIVVFLLLLMVGATSAGIDQYVNRSIQKDFDVIIDNIDDFSIYEDIEQIAGVTDVYMKHMSGAEYDIQGEQDIFIVFGVDDIDVFDTFYAGVVFTDDTMSNLRNIDNGIIIDTYQAERYGLEVGDTFTLGPLDKNFERAAHDQLVEVEVTGMMDGTSLSTNKNVVIVSLSFFQDHFISSLNQIEIKVSGNIAPETVKQTIDNYYFHTDQEVQTFDELLSSQKSAIDTLIQGVLVIVLLGLVIGLLGITNNLLVSFNERKKEYAVLYSVCMSRAQLVKMLFFEMLMTFVAVITIGLIGGLTMNMVWTKLMYAVGLKIAFSFNVGLFIILGGAVFVLLALSSLFIIRKVTRLQVLYELRYE